jgi:diguanylate cyclase (GGDEF)-like protein/PAS domain S-box-containing protein
MKKHIDASKSFDDVLRDKIIGLGEYSIRKSYYPELQSRTQLLESILRTAPVGIGIVVNRIITESNEFLCSMTGYPRNEIIGLDIRMLDADDTGESRIAALLTDLAEGRPVMENIEDTEAKWVCKDGRIIDITFCVAPLDPADPVKGITFIAYDISELKEAEYILVESKEYFATVFNSINDGVLILDSASGVILDANETACRLTGYTKQDIVELPDEWLCSGMQGCSYKEIFHRMYSAKENGPQIFDWLIRKKDGSLLWVELNIIFAKFSKSERLVVTFRDITRRKASEQALYFEKERLRITLQSIGEAVIAADWNGNITLLNDAAEQLTGWTNEEAQGRYIEFVFILENEHADGQKEGPAHNMLVYGTIMKQHEEAVLLSKDGTKHEIAYMMAPIQSEEGEAQGLVLVFRDIALEKEREEEIMYLSYHDSLTGLYNRRYFEAELMRVDDGKNLPVSIIMGDVNGLKLINDVFGHMEGDLLLQSAAQAMKRSCRFEDTIARWGGDEFIILLPGTNERQAEKICKRIHDECTNFNKTVKTSISLGYATKDSDDQDMLQVLKKAEDLMYKNKLLESRSLRSAIVSSIKKTLYEKSHETEEHAERLKELCKTIGVQMGLSQNQLNELELLAVLHDIGKIAIKDSILNKPGKLTDEEWVEMKRHPEIGYRIAQASPELAHVSEYILTHHEWWDGSGYPRGLKNDSIPILSRILSVADAFDAMISDRPYRKALPKEAAIWEISRYSGTQFDPNVVEAFRISITLAETK